jgi:putative endonuclease
MSAESHAIGGPERNALGRLGEQLTAEHLKRSGFSLVARNHRTRYGEIDLVAFDGTTLAFVEVKAHRATRALAAPARDQGPGAPRKGSPELGWPGVRQRRRLRLLALDWLGDRARRPRAKAIRFDAVRVLVDGDDELVSLEHLAGAF